MYMGFKPYGIKNNIMTTTEEAKQFIKAHSELSLFKWYQWDKKRKIDWMKYLKKGAKNETPMLDECIRLIEAEC